ncbi:copper resistance protein CopC [Nonomuraea sp. NPDC050790]|uniref:copper resistance CopC family protein n=1 Tax=Nonomuraea sp. NPDC050790 TaxID=3364371 RepID=UPI0037AF1029
MRRLLTVLLLACAAVGGWIAPAQAHNVLVSSDPREGAALTAAPQRVTLVFDQPVRRGYAGIGLTGPGGEALTAGAAVVAKERVSVPLKTLTANGAYVIGYRILSSDGHPVTGKIHFTLNLPDPTPDQQPAPTDQPTSGPADQQPGPADSQPGPADQRPGTADQEPRPVDQRPGAADGRPGGVGVQPATGSAELSAQAAEAAANGGAGMAVVWIGGALVLLAAGTVIALRRGAQPAVPETPSPGEKGART